MVSNAESESLCSYRGACHCGAIRFEVDGVLEELSACNCSICRRTAYIHWHVPPERFWLLTPKEALSSYQFGTRTAKNHFCRVCGISPFRRARSDPDKIDINVRCLEDVDVDDLEVALFDGRNWDLAISSRSP